MKEVAAVEGWARPAAVLRAASVHRDATAVKGDDHSVNRVIDQAYPAAGGVVCSSSEPINLFITFERLSHTFQLPDCFTDTLCKKNYKIKI
jgi:hypothetical protein